MCIVLRVIIGDWMLEKAGILDSGGFGCRRKVTPIEAAC
jgi:hypothetical protein